MMAANNPGDKMPDVDIQVRTESVDPAKVVPLMERLQPIIAESLGYDNKDAIVAKITPLVYSIGLCDIDVSVLTSPDNEVAIASTEPAAKAIAAELRKFTSDIGQPELSVAAVVRVSAQGKCTIG
jgi:hypothetical protein